MAVFAALFTAALALAQQAAPPPGEAPSSMPADLVAVGDTLCFSADDGIHGRELWAWNARDGCTLAADVLPGPKGSDPRGIRSDGVRAFFAATTASGESGVYAWDSRNGACTALPGFTWTSPSGAARLFAGFKGGFLLFAAPQGQDGNLWCIPFDEPGAFHPATLSPEPAGTLANVMRPPDADGVATFYMEGRLWRTDGTSQGTVAVTRAHQDTEPAPIPLGRRVIFCGYSEECGQEPWVSDGTDTGTQMLRDITEGPSGSGVDGFNRHGDRVYFDAADAKHGSELWATDGTPEGTQLVKDIYPGTDSSNPYGFASADDTLYFLANDGTHGVELWKTDGTNEGTLLVADISPGPAGSTPWKLTPFRGQLYFCATTPSSGDEIWHTDGTPYGTRLLCEISPGAEKGGPHNLAVCGDRLFFTYNEPQYGEELWMTDGTAEGTRLAGDICRPRYNPSSSPSRLTRFGDRLAFAAADVEHGEELWVSDGTEEGTALLCDAMPGEADSHPADLVVAGGSLYFTAEQPDGKRWLWVSDGRPDGTRRVEGPCGGDRGVFVGGACILGETVFLKMRNPDGCESVCRADPLRGCDRIKVNLDRGWRISPLRVLRGRLYFYALGPAEETLLWRMDASDSAPTRVAALPESWGKGDPETIVDSLRAAGTNDAVGEAAEVAMLFPPDATDNIGPPTAVGDELYFVAHTGRNGTELWATDGSLDGTHLVYDAYPGPTGSFPTHLAAIGGSVYFIAEHPYENRVVWRTEGTPDTTRPVTPYTGTVQLAPVKAREMEPLGEQLVLAGSYGYEPATNIELTLLTHRAEGNDFRQVKGIVPGEESSDPHGLTRVGDRIFLVADDRIHGEELWVTDGTDKGTRLVKDILPAADVTAYGPLARRR